MVKRIVFLVWSVMCLAAAIAVIYITTLDLPYQGGEEISVDTDNELIVSGQAKSVNVAGTDPFFLYNEKTNQFVTVSGFDKPFGLSGTSYYFATLEGPNPGIWVVESGSTTVLFEGEGVQITKKVDLVAKLGRIALSFILTLSVWLVSLLFFI